MSFNFFYIQEESGTYGNIPVKYPVAKKSGDGNGLIDVHGSMRWKNSGSVEEVPRILLTEYTLDYSRWSSNINALRASIDNLDQNNNLDPYLKLYSGTATGFSYVLPYLLKPGDSIRGTISNEWQDIDTAGAFGKMLGGKIQSAITKAGEAIAGAGSQFSTGFGTEPVKGFRSTADNKITISFPLYNTHSIEEANNHFSFVSLLAFQNLKTRTSFVSYLPPKIYTVDGVAAGSVYMAAAYVSELRIDSIGTTRCISDFADVGSFGAAYGRGGDQVIIPEAYKVTITLTDILTQSSNVMWGTLGGPVVRVIELPDTSSASGAGNPQGAGPRTPNANPILPPD